MEKNTFISMNEGEEVSASVALPDGLYKFQYQGVTQGQHTPFNDDDTACPTAIVDMLLYMPDGHTEQKKEIIKLLDTKYNQQRIASLFRSLGEPVAANGKVKARWNSFVGRKGWVKLETKRMNNGNNWQSVTFIFPENVEAEKKKYGYQEPTPVQSAPQRQAQPAAQPAPTWNSGKTQW